MKKAPHGAPFALWGGGIAGSAFSDRLLSRAREFGGLFMTGKLKAAEVDLPDYFADLSANLARAELGLLQNIEIDKKLNSGIEMPEGIRVNLVALHAATANALVLALARLFDKGKAKDDQVSIPNLLGHKDIKAAPELLRKVQTLISRPIVTRIKDTRDDFIAHTLSHRQDTSIHGPDIGALIDETYAVLAELCEVHIPGKEIRKNDMTKYREAWRTMIKDWP